MKIQPLCATMLVAILGATMVPAPVSADPPPWAPAHGWRTQQNVEKREERAERREQRALRLRDLDATSADLNRGQLKKLERQDRRESAAARTARENRELQRQREVARIERQRALRREQRAIVPRILID